MTIPLHDEAVQVRRYNALVGPGHVHDALGIPVSGVHARDISLGSGSFDGIFGTTLNLVTGVGSLTIKFSTISAPKENRRTNTATN